MSKLGSYITLEYEVLLKVFSFLDSKSLVSASNVCSEWKRVARRILLRRNRPFGHYKCSGKKWTKECYDTGSQPKVVLHFTSSRGAKNLGSELYPFLSDIYNMEGVPVYSIRNEFFMASDFTEDSLNVMAKLGKNDQGFLVLCDMPGVTIKSVIVRSEIEFEEIIKPSMEDDPKCALIISGGCGAVCELANCVINSLLKIPHIIVAGGIAEYAVKSRPVKKGDTKRSRSCLCLTFHGENITAHSALYQVGDCMEKRIEQLAEDVGPLPPGGYRIAFIFSCVNLLGMLGDKEVQSFTKSFPNVPLYGLWSYGEYMAVMDEAHSNRDKDNDDYLIYPDWTRSECTSYLILTIKRDNN